MAGEADLAALLTALSPVLHGGQWVFVELPDDVDALASFAEREGPSCVVARADADAAGLAYDYVATWIELQVHSDLGAVGLTAAVSTALARAGIPCNVVAARRHDHLFVPTERAAEAMAVLAGLAGAGGSSGSAPPSP